MESGFYYRGYYYDIETGLYYLNSRYYDPETGRFINADGLIDNRGLNTQNLYTYCGNNPINRVDNGGDFWFTSLIVIAVKVIVAVAVATTATVAACAVSNAIKDRDDPQKNKQLRKNIKIRFILIMRV